MNKATLLVATLLPLLVASCEKYEVAPKSPVVEEDSLKYNLDFSSAALGIKIVDRKPEWISPLVQFENGQNRRFGDLVTIESPEHDITFKFFYWYGKGVTQCNGRIGNKTFVIDIEASTMSICGGQNNIPIIYDLFSEPGEIDS